MNPIIAAMLEMLATNLTGLALEYSKGKMSDDNAMEALNEILENVVPGDDAPAPAPSPAPTP